MSVKITAEAFFTEKLDSSIPMLNGIGEIYKTEGVVAAEKAFATFIREGGMLRDDFFFRDDSFTMDDAKREEGERILDGWLSSVGVPMQFPGRKVDWSANPTFNKYCEWTWQLARHPEWAQLGALYRATGDERYTEATRIWYKWFSYPLMALTRSGNPSGEFLAEGNLFLLQIPFSFRPCHHRFLYGYI